MLERHLADGRMQLWLTDRRTWKRPIIREGGHQVLVVRSSDEADAVLQAFGTELEFNRGVASRAGTDQLGTEFSLLTLERMLTSGIGDRLGGDLQNALQQARGAMQRANRAIEASLQFPRMSNSWANAMNAASRAIVDARPHLDQLRELMDRLR